MNKIAAVLLCLILSAHVIAQTTQPAAEVKSPAAVEAIFNEYGETLFAHDDKKLLVAAHQKGLAALKAALRVAGGAKNFVEIHAISEAIRNEESEIAKLTNVGTGLFGAADARKIVYVCDATGSMQSCFQDLRKELKASVDSLLPRQFFNVIFYTGENAVPFNRDGLAIANEHNKSKLSEFVDDISPKEGSDPMPAIRIALASKPDVIYFVTDGFAEDARHEDIVVEISQRNEGKKMKFNCILLSSDPTKEVGLKTLLERIAKANGGECTVIEKFTLGHAVK